MSTSVEREIGRLSEGQRLANKTLDSHTELLVSMDNKLDGLVSPEAFDRHVNQNQVEHKSLDTRVKVLEDWKTNTDNSIWTKSKKSFEAKLISIIGGSLLILVATGALFIYQQNIKANEDFKAVKSIVGEK